MIKKNYLDKNYQRHYLSKKISADIHRFFFKNLINFFNIYILKTTFIKNLPRWVILLIDILIVSGSYLLSNYIINSFIANFDITYVLLKTPIIALVYLIYFLIIGTYKGIVRQTGLKDAQNVFYSNLLAFLTLLLLNLTLRSFINFDNDSDLIPFKFSYRNIWFFHPVTA